MSDERRPARFQAMKAQDEAASLCTDSLKSTDDDSRFEKYMKKKDITSRHSH